MFVLGSLCALCTLLPFSHFPQHITSCQGLHMLNMQLQVDGQMKWNSIQRWEKSYLTHSTTTNKGEEALSSLEALLVFAMFINVLLDRGFGQSVFWLRSSGLIHLCVFCSPAHDQVPTPPERGLLHIWQSAGPSDQLCPQRVLLSRPVLQVTLGEHHGLLLTQGECVFVVKSNFSLDNSHNCNLNKKFSFFCFVLLIS